MSPWRKTERKEKLMLMGDGIIWAEEMENFLKTCRQGLYNRIQRGTLPKPLKISGRLCWRREDWDKWLENEAIRQGAAVRVAAEPEPPRRRRGRPRKNESVGRERA
jgi:predicted DNA-binding transcriptional regulator AlpA